jgi:hypothetical protein
MNFAEPIQTPVMVAYKATIQCRSVLVTGHPGRRSGPVRHDLPANASTFAERPAGLRQHLPELRACRRPISVGADAVRQHLPARRTPCDRVLSRCVRICLPVRQHLLSRPTSVALQQIRALYRSAHNVDYVKTRYGVSTAREEILCDVFASECCEDSSFVSLGKSFCHQKSQMNQRLINPVTQSPVAAHASVTAGLILMSPSRALFGGSDSNDRALLAAVTQMTSLG